MQSHNATCSTVRRRHTHPHLRPARVQALHAVHHILPPEAQTRAAPECERLHGHEPVRVAARVHYLRVGARAITLGERAANVNGLETVLGVERLRHSREVDERLERRRPAWGAHAPRYEGRISANVTHISANVTHLANDIVHRRRDHRAHGRRKVGTLLCVGERVGLVQVHDARLTVREEGRRQAATDGRVKAPARVRVAILRAVGWKIPSVLC